MLGARGMGRTLSRFIFPRPLSSDLRQVPLIVASRRDARARHHGLRESLSDPSPSAADSDVRSRRRYKCPYNSASSLKRHEDTP